MAILAAGAGGGLAASIATCPLDVVKTKLQAQRATLGQADYLGISGLSNPLHLCMHHPSPNSDARTQPAPHAPLLTIPYFDTGAM